MSRLAGLLFHFSRKTKMTNISLRAAEPAKPSAFSTADEWNEFYERLERLLDEHGAGLNKNDQARLLIAACVTEGINIVSQIITAVAPLGFDPRHLGALMNSDQDGWWRRARGGVLTLAPN